MQQLKIFLEQKVALYNHPSFIANDPISIPHRFSKQQDIEIAGFFAAIFAWGNRKSIINSCNRLLALMNDEPYHFILNFDEENKDMVSPFLKFAHRTFNTTDLLHLFNFFHFHYAIKKENSLETAFTKWLQPGDINVENALNGFHRYIFNESYFADYPVRTKKHIAAPFKKSGCKRLNMFLRWMVRNNNTGVDFGLWKNISPAQLIIPIDVHVARTAKSLGIYNNTKTDWESALELTSLLKSLDKTDPAKYDFALFGLGVMEHWH